MAFALLVLFALVDDEGGAILEIRETLEEIRVELEVAGGSTRALPGAHAADGESARGHLVAELDQVLWLVAEQAHDHVAGDAQLVRVLPAKQAAQGPDEARVRHGAGYGGQEAARTATTASTTAFLEGAHLDGVCLMRSRGVLDEEPEALV